MPQLEMNKCRLVFSGLTNSIYIARFGKDPCVSLDKVERESDFINVLLQWCPAGTQIDLGPPNDPQFVVSMQTVEARAKEARQIESASAMLFTLKEVAEVFEVWQGEGTLSPTEFELQGHVLEAIAQAEGAAPTQPAPEEGGG